MQSNPIQRKTRNAFLIGMLIMLVLAIVIVALIYIFVLEDKLTVGSEEDPPVLVYQVISTIKAGSDISGKIQQVERPTSEVPTNYATYETVMNQGSKAKVDLEPGTIITNSLLYTPDEDTINNQSLRLVEFNMITPPSSLRVGDYIDVRLTIPSGQSFIVLAKKCVMSLQDTTIGLYLTEDEIVTMNCAIIESYIMTASNMEAIQYIDPGIQEAAEITYPVNSAVRDLYTSNPNILTEAKTALKDRLTKSGTTIRNNYINSDLSDYSVNAKENIEASLQEQIETARELYLSGLSGY